jgi:hypothetical protein
MQRTPFPHISPWLPSELNMIIRKSAFFEGAMRMRPSAPTPVRRSDIATASLPGLPTFSRNAFT